MFSLLLKKAIDNIHHFKSLINILREFNFLHKLVKLEEVYLKYLLWFKLEVDKRI